MDDEEVDDDGFAAELVELDGAAPAVLAAYRTAPATAAPATAISPIVALRRPVRGGCGLGPLTISSWSGLLMGSVTVGVLRWMVSMWK